MVSFELIGRLMHEEPLAIVALGSNLGDSLRIMKSAMKKVRAFSNHSLRCSSIWRSTPVNCPPGSPDFLNAVMTFVPCELEGPEFLLTKLQFVERAFGRRPKRWLNEARPLDLDLIAFGQQTRNSPELILPHPRAHQRRFVLQPLAEIAPDLVLPGQSKAVSQLLDELITDEELERITE